MTAKVTVDAHHHLWKLSGDNYSWIQERIDTPSMRAIARDFEAPELRTLQMQHDVARSVLVQGEPTVAETDDMLAIADANDFIAGVVGWIDLEAPDAVSEVVRRAADPRFLGLRVWLLRNADPAWILNAAQAPGLRAVEAADMCVDALLRPHHIENLLLTLDRYPRLRVVVCHGAKPVPTEWTPGDSDFQTWTVGMKALAERGCYVKMSGIMTESGEDWQPADVKPYLDTILDAFGAARTMWGSDWPVVNRGGGYGKWLCAVDSLTRHLDASERERLFGGTATEFYRLG